MYKSSLTDTMKDNMKEFDIINAISDDHGRFFIGFTDRYDTVEPIINKL